MNFVSPTYACFLALVTGVYWLLPGRRQQHVLLLLASYLFYMWWDARFAVLLVLSTGVDYVAGARIHASIDAGARRRWLVFSLAANLGVLGTFKYFHFFVDSFIAAAATAGVTLHAPTIHIVLPVGISFFTFQSMSYTLDIHGGRLQPVRDLVAFALYVAFFPQLVAGPIVRARDFLPQLQSRRAFRPTDWQRGLERILAGLVKKAVIADSLALFCDPIFRDPGLYPTPEAWIALVAFYGQIYCDFSGYSDIAIGSAALLGFRFHENFDRPYLARSPQDFWRRWHISLSTWLRDYLYVPLGGNRGGPARQQRNLFVTMLLGGLWHGAAWHFVLWGAWHGGWLGGFHAYRQRRPAGHVPAWVALAATQLAVCIGWGLFRAPDFPRLLSLEAALLRQEFALPTPQALGSLALCAAVVAAELSRPIWNRLGRRRGLDLLLRPLAYIACIYAVLAYSPFDPRVFIYFQF